VIFHFLEKKPEKAEDLKICSTGYSYKAMLFFRVFDF